MYVLVFLLLSSSVYAADINDPATLNRTVEIIQEQRNQALTNAALMQAKLEQIEKKLKELQEKEKDKK